MEKRPRSKGFRTDRLAPMRKYAGPGIVALVGLGQSVSGLQNIWIGVALMGLGGLWALQYAVVGVRDKRRKIHDLVQPTDEDRLAVRFEAEIKQADTIQRNFLIYPGYSPKATAAMLYEPCTDALKWISRVEQMIEQDQPLWLHEYRSAGFELPDEMDPEDTTVGEVTSLLEARVGIVKRIVRELRAKGDR